MSLLTAKGISSVAIELLVRTLVLPRTVTMIPGGEFAGHNGDTITVRVRQPRSARTQDSPGDEITFDDQIEVPVDVVLKHLYDGKLVTDEELSLDIEDFAMQITTPQVESVATAAEDELANAMNGLDEDDSISSDGSDIEEKILEAREFLSDNNVPAGDRYMAVSPQVATYVLSVDKFVRVNESGTQDRLQDAMLGRLYGFNFVESPGLDDGTAVAYHRSAFAMANRIPREQRGANDSASATTQEIGLRQTFDRIPNRLSDASIVHTFAGASPVWDNSDNDDNQRFYKFDTAA